jgi:hypothetical protein
MIDDLAIFHTEDACCGSAAAYLLRRIAYRAGAYAPGIDDALFGELHRPDTGASMDHVLRWFARRHAHLLELGYRVHCACVVTSSAELFAWVRQARGYRGAVITSEASDDIEPHGVAMSSERADTRTDAELVVVDPWPSARPRRIDEAADSRPREIAALALHWSGWA